MNQTRKIRAVARLDRLTAELASLRLYPEDELSGIEIEYHHHRANSDTQDVAELSKLLKKLNALMKGPRHSDQKKPV